MEMSENQSGYLSDVHEAAQGVDQMVLTAVIDALESAYRDGSAVFIIGNGGSSANASHFAQDLAKAPVDIEACTKGFDVRCLTDSTAMVTALSNDISYESVFDIQLRQLGKKGDLLVAISGSGNSPNILRACEYAREAGICVVGLTGFDGGKLAPLSDLSIHVPVMDMGKTEAVHGILLHMVPDFFRGRLELRS